MRCLRRRHRTDYRGPFEIAPPGWLVVVAAEQESEHETHGGRDRDRRSGVLTHVGADVVPQVSVVFLDAVRRRFDRLLHVLADVIELIARLRVGVPEDLFGLVDFVFHEVPGPIERSLFPHSHLRLEGTHHIPLKPACAPEPWSDVWVRGWSDARRAGRCDPSSARRGAASAPTAGSTSPALSRSPRS